jgi:hypothetical protein
MLEFGRNKLPLDETSITVRGVDGEYTPEYVNLTKDFYLAF